MRRALALALSCAACSPGFAPTGDRLGTSFAPLDGSTVTAGAVRAASDRAFCTLLRDAPWGEATLMGALTGAAIGVHPTPTVTAWGGAAGFAWPLYRTVDVGSDFAALVHEFAELAYYDLEPGGTWEWHDGEWPGRAGVERAVAAYVAGERCP